MLSKDLFSIYASNEFDLYTYRYGKHILHSAIGQTFEWKLAAAISQSCQNCNMYITEVVISNKAKNYNYTAAVLTIGFYSCLFFFYLLLCLQHSQRSLTNYLIVKCFYFL